MKLSRRILLVHACRIPIVAALGSIAACAEKTQVAQCADPDQLTDAEISLRTSVQYTERSRDAAQTCRGCAFFRASSGASECGTCEIVNGSVSSNGHCASWSAKG